MSTFHPFSCTSSEFASHIGTICGTKPPLPLCIYQTFIRTGALPHDLPAFRNAPCLLEQMISLTDQQIDPVSLIENDNQTEKFLTTTVDGLSIESVIIHQKDRVTLCVSSQIGCRMGCRFCRTGQSGFVRNLTTKEIVQQAYIAIHIHKAPIKNIVFMGMGEPFDNYENVMQAVRVLADPLGFGFGIRRITVSTSGIITGILRLADQKDPSPNLAVSLGAPTDDLRRSIMPLKVRLEDLRSAMKTYCTKKDRQILLSYVLLKGINDSPTTADSLADFVKDLDVRINIIPYNASPGSEFSRPRVDDVQAFVERLRSYHLPVFIRQEHGTSINAACGQLASRKPSICT